MGMEITLTEEPDAIRRFTQSILRDLAALERMLQEDRIESGVRRVGAEQELFLVTRGWRPALLVLQVLERLQDGIFSTELAQFNLEANLEPVHLTGDGLGRMEAQLNQVLEKARNAAAAEGGDVVMAGILPTLVKSDLSLESLTPRQRYRALNDAFCRLRQGPSYRLRIEGIDELMLEHESVMLEACNTSFQAHLQVSGPEFPSVYNAAQAVLAPVLAAAANSPVLFGKRLWSETRIALFQQSLDTRGAAAHLRELPPRVRFGDQWVKSSVLELFQEDLGRFPVLLATEVEEDAIAVLDRGDLPMLRALQLYNSTVYRWNRPCYGITDGKPHLRIECRALPSGPSVVDEVANAAFWIGATLGVVEEFGDIGTRMDFDDARGNFVAAARQGLNAALMWEGDPISAPRLIQDTLLPLARSGLEGAGVEGKLVDRYLGTIQGRVASGQNGATWMLRSLAAMKDQGVRTERTAAVTAATARRQREGDPVHTWSLADIHEAGGWREHYLRVEQYMTTRLVTVRADEPVGLAAFLLDRNQIRQLPVEDGEHRLVGLLTFRSILRLLTEVGMDSPSESRPARLIMEPDPIFIAPEATTLEAIRLMREHGVSCLPVVKDDRLVGIVTERDILPVAYRLLEDRLREEEEAPE
jgi:CBS domain-containing protein